MPTPYDPPTLPSRQYAVWVWRWGMPNCWTGIQWWFLTQSNPAGTSAAWASAFATYLLGTVQPALHPLALTNCNAVSLNTKTSWKTGDVQFHINLSNSPPANQHLLDEPLCMNVRRSFNGKALGRFAWPLLPVEMIDGSFINLLWLSATQSFFNMFLPSFTILGVTLTPVVYSRLHGTLSKIDAMTPTHEIKYLYRRRVRPGRTSPPPPWPTVIH